MGGRHGFMQRKPSVGESCWMESRMASLTLMKLIRWTSQIESRWRWPNGLGNDQGRLMFEGFTARCRKTILRRWTGTSRCKCGVSMCIKYYARKTVSFQQFGITSYISYEGLIIKKFTLHDINQTWSSWAVYLPFFALTIPRQRPIFQAKSYY